VAVKYGPKFIHVHRKAAAGFHARQTSLGRFAIPGVPGQRGRGQQGLGCGKPARGRCGVRRIARPHEQLLSIVGGVEEATLSIAEVSEHAIEQHRTDGQPLLFSGDGVQRQHSLSHVRVVLKNSGRRACHAITGGASESPRPIHMDRQE